MKKLTAFAVVLIVFVSTESQLVTAVSWTNGSQITSGNLGSNQFPSLLLNSKTQKAWVFYSSNKLGNFDIYYRIYDPGCLQNACFIPTENRLTFDPLHNNILSSATQTTDGKVWVFFTSDRPGANNVYYKTYNGTAWTGDIRFTNMTGNHLNPAAVATMDGGLWVTWASNLACTASPCASNLYLRKFNGTAWSSLQQITFSGRDFAPAMSQASNGTVWLAWSTDRASIGKHDIFYKTITGTRMTNDTQLTTDPHDSTDASIVAVQNGGVLVLFSSNRSGWFDRTTNTTIPKYDLFFKYTVTSGLSWSKDTQLTFNPNSTAFAVDNVAPSAAQVGQGKIGVVNWNIFSLTLMIADIRVTAVVPFQTVVAQGVTLKVSATIANLGLGPSTFLTTLSANGTAIGSIPTTVNFMSAQTISFSWNTTGWTRGKYFLTVNATNVPGENNPGNTVLTTTIILTIPGDVTGDGKVNISDLVVVALSFGTKAGGAGYNPNADVDLDGVIDIRDLTFVAIHFGQTG
jgi:hypothetical protein